MTTVNKLILGDNLEILRTMEPETVDLIYLDPPFFSNRNYEVIWGDSGEVRSFQDRWAGGIDHYIAWLKERVAEMHRILKPTGSIFLHCDWHANAYIRVEILDKIFGYGNFRNEILWLRTTNSGSSKAIAKRLPNDTDSVFYYSKSVNCTFNKIMRGHGEEYLQRFKYKDDYGFYRWQALKTYSQETYDRLEKENKVRKSANAKYPEFKQYFHELKGGVSLNNLWNDINAINPMAKEVIGYPTQKPEALLQRIIEMASNEGDIVLDPFVGGGTTVAVADRLNRRWIGIDQSVQAIKVTELRLDKQHDLFSAPFIVQLHKYDYDTLRHKNAFEFENWIIQQFGGAGNARQRGDFGLDGKMPDNTPIQVKRSDNIGRNVVDNFKSAAERSDKKLFDKNVANGKPVGYIIAFSFGRGAVEEVARLKLKENIIIELVAVNKIVPIAMKPTLTIEINELDRDAKGVREIEFVAKGASEAGIEFYSWDFDYNAEKGFKASVMIDREGRQTAKFKAGLHSVAVKVVDNDGLENIEVVRLKVNGTVERQ
ncbi:MAG: site-specific DNA-methyltransferase [Odoribacteraceae bacterium]|jgi:site-specific DNA-methyltransferase (adenine-specific)|nr:site-specific DNA-methyltransferase [Odoribacteraceae bacterium]